MDPGLVSGIYISIHAPRGGNDTPLRVHGRIQQYFNPRSPHGERPQSSTLRPRRTLISIHAPRMGSDTVRQIAALERRISIHAPRMGSDMDSKRHCPASEISIHAPRMGSDRDLYLLSKHWRYFNPRSPHGERPYSASDTVWAYIISIHAPRMGSDLSVSFHILTFLISIHAPRMGSDGKACG